MTNRPAQNNNQQEPLSPAEQEVQRLLALGYPRDMLHIDEDGKVLIYKLDEMDGIQEMWEKIKEKK